MDNPKELGQWFLRYHKILSSKPHKTVGIEAKKFKKPNLLPIIKKKKKKPKGPKLRYEKTDEHKKKKKIIIMR